MLMFFCINVNADNSFIAWSFLTHEDKTSGLMRVLNFTYKTQF
jgi:hypothetical protein